MKERKYRRRIASFPVQNPSNRLLWQSQIPTSTEIHLKIHIIKYFVFLATVVFDRYSHI
jgi:hypothetical protein